MLLFKSELMIISLICLTVAVIIPVASDTSDITVKGNI